MTNTTKRHKRVIIDEEKFAAVKVLLDTGIKPGRLATLGDFGSTATLSRIKVSPDFAAFRKLSLKHSLRKVKPALPIGKNSYSVGPKENHLPITAPDLQKIYQVLQEHTLTLKRLEESNNWITEHAVLSVNQKRRFF